MFSKLIIASFLLGSALAGVVRRGTTVWATPHDSYSSSVGVLGCHINTNRVAYWPGMVDCDKMCIKLSHKGRSEYLLKIDSSEGAYDISFDAWNELVYGASAMEDPQPGGPIEMTYEDVDMSYCADLIFTPSGKLPFSASNSAGFVANCLDNHPNSYVAKNYVMYNVVDAVCGYGYDELCEFDYPATNQPSCGDEHVLGLTTPLEPENPVVNIRYPTGELFYAANGLATTTDVPQTSGASSNTKPEGAAFKENSSNSSGTDSSGGSSSNNNNSTSSGVVTPFQIMLILAAMVKNAVKDS